LGQTPQSDLVFIIGTVIGWAALSEALLRRAQEEVTSKAQLLLEMMEAVRDYTNIQVSPLLTSQLETQPEFILQAIPQYSAREVFENLRKNEQYSGFLYKDTALNPLGTRSKADAFEAELVQPFRHQTGESELFGFRNMLGEQLFYSTWPVVITKESCLRCHGDPAATPQSLLAAYGAENGFGWQLNEVVGAHIIYVPAENVFSSARQSLYLIISIFVAIFAIVIVLINLLLR
jgi:hypothetical protein